MTPLESAVNRASFAAALASRALHAREPWFLRIGGRFYLATVLLDDASIVFWARVECSPGAQSLDLFAGREMAASQPLVVSEAQSQVPLDVNWRLDLREPAVA